MKPRNFPGRKNDRRIRALARMERPKFHSLADEVLHPYSRTQSRIIPSEMARAIRTKKDRSARAKVSR